MSNELQPEPGVAEVASSVPLLNERNGAATGLAVEDSFCFDISWMKGEWNPIM